MHSHIVIQFGLLVKAQSGGIKSRRFTFGKRKTYNFEPHTNLTFV
jgi:hypothetical protein